MLAQVRCCTKFQELPWKSTVDVPWTVVRGTAAQLFCPFSATPKHFCLPGATAALPSALVSGAAAAIDAGAVATAPASTNALTVDLADIWLSPFGLVAPLPAHARSFAVYARSVTPTKPHSFVTAWFVDRDVTALCFLMDRG